jgi:heme/copper-type cytochrome/quinol oxidase subunit 1
MAERRLLQLWERSHNTYGWLAIVDHKDLGIRYLVTAFRLLLIGGIEALMLRIQLAR